MKSLLTPDNALPSDLDVACLIVKAWIPNRGAVVGRLTRDEVLDLSALSLTCSGLLELENVVDLIKNHKGPVLCKTADVLSNAHHKHKNTELPWLMAPCDLQAIKAAGVTFVQSMLERVIEEQARGDASKAQSVRNAVTRVIGDNLTRVIPGSQSALALKEVLIKEGIWSQYLEVGIGVDAEIFTKSQPMSAVGTGAEIGIHPKSAWNNPESEIVLAVNSKGKCVGATLGNDVNLRDFEGRSALLLGKAKDNNASCSIGPCIRLFDEHFDIDDVRACALELEIRGEDGFVLKGSSELSKISRDPLDLVAQTINENHQYPDGFMLFLGTMFAPTQDRPLGEATSAGSPGEGFTHKVGDQVRISTPRLGTLINRVNTTDQIAPWIYGVNALMNDLMKHKH
jgi:fumarylacetoacetate (FAA) hydrolase family protein